MDIIIRPAETSDFDSVVHILNQVQALHVNWRPHFFEMLKDLKKEKHFDGIELQVNAKNVAAYEMYKKYGFTEKSINMELL